MTPISLIPGTLPSGYCWPADPQQYNVDIVTRISAFLDENFPGVYVGASEPPADQRDRVWFNTTSQKWYWYINGNWVRTYEVPAGTDVEWIWKGAEASLVTFAGGSAGAVGDATGPLWEVDHAIDGRALVGAGTIPTSAPPVTLAQGDTGGEAAHLLTEAEGAVGLHTHPFGKSNNASGAGGDDAFFAQTGMQTVAGYTGTYITGSNGVIQTPLTDADLFTLAANKGAGATATGHNNLQPYIARFAIKRTSRIYVIAPY